MGNTLSEVFTPSNPPPINVIATGLWRDNMDDDQSSFTKLKSKLPDYINLIHISQEEEGIKAAQCAHRYMSIQGILDNLIEKCGSVFDEPLFLYIGAGRGSTQIVLLKRDGSVKVIFKGPGYPRNGDSPVKALSLICEDIKQLHDGNIIGIFAYDSIFHVLKTECPVVQNEYNLPETITTSGKDFRKLGYLANHFEDVPMIVFRNFKTKDNIMRKVTFLEGEDLQIDLGSGEAKLTDPRNGQQLSVVELPEKWKTNESSLEDIVTILNEMAHYSEEDKEPESDCSYCGLLRYL